MQPHENSEKLSDMTTDSECAERRVERVMELFLEQLEAGDYPDREAFLAKYPDIARLLEGQLEMLECLHQAPPHVLSANPNSATENDLQERAALGDFQLLQPIGRGGMGIVYEAKQLSLDRRVAVKRLELNNASQTILLD